MPRSSIISLLALSLLVPLLQTWALALPDAQLLRIQAQGSDFREGDRVPLRIEVRNAGGAALPSLPVTLSVGGKPYADWKTPPDLAPGQTATWSLTWNAVSGSFPFVATVDPFSEIQESDEVNNSTFINIGAAEPPEPSPWPAVLAAFLSFLLALAFGFLLGRLFLSRRQREDLSRFARRPPP